MLYLRPFTKPQRPLMPINERDALSPVEKKGGHKTTEKGAKV